MSYRKYHEVEQILSKIKTENHEEKKFASMDDDHKIRELRKMKARYADILKGKRLELQKINREITMIQNKIILMTKLIDRKDFGGFKKAIWK